MVSALAGVLWVSDPGCPVTTSLVFCISRARRVYCQEKNSGVFFPKSVFSGVRECQFTHGSAAPWPSQMAGSSP
eukprot:12318772-Prorocentrum_lima.AAC.1